MIIERQSKKIYIGNVVDVLSNFSRQGRYVLQYIVQEPFFFWCFGRKPWTCSIVIVIPVSTIRFSWHMSRRQ